MKEYIELVIREHTQYIVLGVSSNNFKNDDYIFNQLRSCHVTSSEGKHDICATTRCAAMSVYRSPFCPASLISDNLQTCSTGRQIPRQTESCQNIAFIKKRFNRTSSLLSPSPITTYIYFVKNF